MARQRAVTPEEAKEIREKYWTDLDATYWSLSKLFRVSEATIRNIVNRNGAYVEEQNERKGDKNEQNRTC